MFDTLYASAVATLRHTLLDTGVQRELLLVAMCLVLALLLRYFVMGLLARRPVRDAVPVEAGAREAARKGFRKLLFPLIALALVGMARALLHKHQATPMLDLAQPLLLCLAVVRVFALGMRQVFGSGVLIAGLVHGFSLLAWVAVALNLFGWLPDLVDALQGIAFDVGEQKLNLWMLLQGCTLVLLSLLVALWIGSAVERRLMRAEEFDDSTRLAVSRLLRSLLVVAAVLVSLPAVGIDLTTLSVFGGAIGVGLGFGLQRIAANYASGFIILLDRSLRIGNLIEVGGERGVVSSITTRYTVIRAANGVESIVPNETLLSSVVRNDTFSDARVMLGVDVTIARGDDLEQALAVLAEVGGGHPRVLAEPAPEAMVLEFAERGIHLRLGCWVERPQQGIERVRSDLLRAVWTRFSAAGIEIPFGQKGHSGAFEPAAEASTAAVTAP